MTSQLLSLLQQLKERLARVAASRTEGVAAMDLVQTLHAAVEGYQPHERAAPRLRQ